MRPLTGHQLVVDDLPEQGVTERDMRVVLSTGRHEDPPLDDLAEGGSHLRCREVGHRDQQLVVDPRPGDRRDAQDLLAGVRDGRDAREDDIAQPRRDCVRAGLARRGDHLLGVERVPVGPLERPVDQPGVRGVTELIGEQPSQLVTIEPGKVDAIDALVALELGQERQEGAARIDLVGPDGGDDQHPLVSKVAHQERQEIARRLVGPLEVLDHEEHGAESGDPFEDPEDELEQADLGESLVGRRALAIERVRRRPRLRVLPVGSAANLGHQAGQLASARSEERRQRPRVDVAEERPERLDERPVREPAGPEREARRR